MASEGEMHYSYDELWTIIVNMKRDGIISPDLAHDLRVCIDYADDYKAWEK